MLVDTIVEDDRWEQVDLSVCAERAARKTLQHVNLSPDGYEIVLLACNDARMSVLNNEFRGRQQSTNVLSWPSDELGATTEGDAPVLPPVGTDEDLHCLGDIALAFETCQQEAADQDKQLDAHLTHLVVHGVLHLLGYDHVRDADATLMEGLEVEILGKLGLSDPYRVNGGPNGL